LNKARPLGVTIVAILTVINGIILLASGVFAVVFAPQIITSTLNQAMSNVTVTDQQGQELATNIAGAASTAAVIGGGIVIAFGIAWLLIAWGLFTAKGWAWIITVILAIISAIFSAIGIGGGGFIPHVIILIIDIVILYYMYRPNVKSYFGRIKIAK
jgi:uncharacterized membrane protein (DUF2068 family)